MMTSNEQTVADTFPLDVKDHRLEMLYDVRTDSGAYRHLKCSAPGTRIHWFEIITAPGSLTIRGDMGTQVFAGSDDMLFFFNTDDVSSINPGYWQEKVVAQDVNQGLYAYSETVAREKVAEATASWVEEGSPEAAQLDGVLRELLDDCADDETELRVALGHLWFQGRFLHDVDEWDLTEFSYRFLWNCRAIRWALEEYRLAQGASA